jgi:hypothetical protein
MVKKYALSSLIKVDENGLSETISQTKTTVIFLIHNKDYNSILPINLILAKSRIIFSVISWNVTVPARRKYVNITSYEKTVKNPKNEIYRYIRNL